jgi:hypothetical protein
VNLCAGVDEALVAMSEGVTRGAGGGGARRLNFFGGQGRRLRGCGHHVFAGRSVTSEVGGGSRGSSRGRGRGYWRRVVRSDDLVNLRLLPACGNEIAERARNEIHELRVSQRRTFHHPRHSLAF